MEFLCDSDFLYYLRGDDNFVIENKPYKHMKRLLTFYLLLCAICVAQAQLRVLPKGTILAGRMNINTGLTEPGIVPFGIDSMNGNIGDVGELVQDTLYDKNAAIHVWSPTAGKPAYIGFGTKGVKAGEDSSGRLSLSGLFGAELSTLSGTVFKCNDSGSFKFRRDVETTGVFITSDSRLKTDVSDLDFSAADGLSQLIPVSYRYIPAENSDGSSTVTSADEPLRYGLIAQQVQEVYPELVHEDADGNLSVDYIGLIPLMLAKINSLEEQLNIATTEPQMAPAAGVNGIEGTIVSKLYQNSPNPFSVSTNISCDLPETVHDASIRIYDLQGQQLSVLTVSDRGHASVTLRAESLRPGMYIYALIADGQEIDAKRMIITE